MIPCSHPVLSCADAKAWEAQRLPDEAAAWSAMRQAGAGVAQAILDDYAEIGGLPAGARLLVLAGKGNNAGDALLAARKILEHCPQATADIVFAFDEGLLRPLALRAWQALRDEGLPTRVRRISLNHDILATRYDLCLDGIFGFQFRAPMDAATAALIARVNAAGEIRFRAAVDLPSGVGETSAPTAFRADFTYATGIVKSPALRPENAAAIGRLRYVDLGLVDGQSLPEATARVLTTGLLEPLGRLRPAHADKRTFGHLLVVGGSHGYPGAVLMAVRAALHSGVGLLTAFVPEKFVPAYAARHPEAMWVGCPVDAAGGLAAGTLALVRERLARADAVVIGPGLSADPATIALAGEIVGTVKVPVAIDADALRPEVLARARPGAFICTPHAGEFKRIAGERTAEAFCADTGAVLVLKGAITRVVTGGTSHHSLFGGPVLARGGSGDLLAGLIGGLLAQAPAAPALAAARGVVWHGHAADLLARAAGQVSVETTQLIEHLGPALRQSPRPSTNHAG